MACAVSGPRPRVRDIFGAGNHHSAILNGSADVYTGKASEFVDKMNSKTRELCSDRDTAVQFQKTKQTKTPVAMGRGYWLMAIKPTDNTADQEQKRNKKENQDRQNNNLAITNCKKLHTTKSFSYSCKDTKLRNSSKNRRRIFSLSSYSRAPKDSIALSKIE